MGDTDENAEGIFEMFSRPGVFRPVVGHLFVGLCRDGPRRYRRPEAAGAGRGHQ